MGSTLAEIPANNFGAIDAFINYRNIEFLLDFAEPTLFAPIAARDRDSGGHIEHFARTRRSRRRSRHPERHSAVVAALGTHPGALASPDLGRRVSLAPIGGGTASHENFEPFARHMVRTRVRPFLAGYNLARRRPCSMDEPYQPAAAGFINHVPPAHRWARHVSSIQYKPMVAAHSGQPWELR